MSSAAWFALEAGESAREHNQTLLDEPHGEVVPGYRVHEPRWLSYKSNPATLMLEQRWLHLVNVKVRASAEQEGGGWGWCCVGVVTGGGRHTTRR